MNPSSSIPFDNSYARLPERFFSRQLPTPVAAPSFIRTNKALAEQLNIDPTWLDSNEALLAFAGNQMPSGAEPIATVYAGHQFGGWNPQLGDGRAILLGEVIGRDGQRYDIQLKGSGRTPYSRGGDGRSPLGPVLREYIISEAMAALGVPTTRSLAAVSSGEIVFREEQLAGAVLTRVASSHVRVGTFQYFAARGDNDAVRILADHVIARHYPHIANAENPYQALLENVIERQAKLIAQWQQLGFIHGVMNTDNMLVCGETIDYGPCAFMDAFNANQVYSSIDRQGRYAFRNQPAIAQWNLARLAQSLLSLIAESEAEALPLAQKAIDNFSAKFQNAFVAGILKKIGLAQTTEKNIALIDDLFKTMSDTAADYTLTFRRLSELSNNDDNRQYSVRELFELPPEFSEWTQRWLAQLAHENREPALRQAEMFAVNPAFIPRNHLVEEAIAAAYGDDFAPFHRLVDVLANPYLYRRELARYAMPPLPEQIVHKTFCGT